MCAEYIFIVFHKFICDTQRRLVFNQKCSNYCINEETIIKK
jgi:hypothetical protein